MDTYWWDTYVWDTFGMDMCGICAMCWICVGYVWCEIRTGGIRMCGIRLEWICVGYVQCAGYVWDMCGVRYANNLLKNPATKRLLGIRRLNPLWHYGSWVSLILMGLRWLVFPGSLVLSSCGAASRCTTRLAGDAYILSRSLGGWNSESYIVLTRHKGAEPF